jgi:putative NADH-flavin reductase
MKLIVFGATGATGRLFTESALAAEHSVTAFVRNSKRLPISHSSLRIIEGDVMDPASVASALPGHEASICALGTMPEGKGDSARRQPGVPVCSIGTKNILDAMDSCGCRRILVESSASVGDSFFTGFLGAGLIVRLALRQVMADKELQEAAITSSTCDWTILRPVKLTNATAKGKLRSGIDLRWSIASRVTRADVANYMVKILTDGSTYRKAITLKN